jgi:16S rRNA (uracil1498-N3)-methyltransferase
MTVIVGPEGDFSESEISLLNNYEIPLVNLGPRRLRSETACISSIISVNNIMEN